MDPKTSLTGVFAHELRNALSPARAALELLQRREAGNESLQPALRTIERSFSVALQTIDRFVEAQRIMDGTIKLQVVSIPIDAMVEQAVEMARPALAERGQRVVSNVDKPAVAAEGDAMRSTQVLAQLIENASVAAAADVTIDVQASADDRQIEIAVREPAPRDEGFDPVASLASLRAPAHTRGIALATAARLMALQQGGLDARIDTETGGALFVMTLPRSAVAEREAQPGTQSSVSVPDETQAAPVESSGGVPQRILLVDDNQAIRSIYREALEELGYQVTLAANGEDALRAVETSIPQVALIDVHLPTLNGYQLARTLRARHPSSGIKLVLLSGMTLDEDMIRLSKNAGFDHCIDKSAGPKAIDALLRR